MQLGSLHSRVFHLRKDAFQVSQVVLFHHIVSSFFDLFYHLLLSLLLMGLFRCDCPARGIESRVLCQLSYAPTGCIMLLAARDYPIIPLRSSHSFIRVCICVCRTRRSLSESTASRGPISFNSMDTCTGSLLATAGRRGMRFSSAGIAPLDDTLSVSCSCSCLYS